MNYQYFLKLKFVEYFHFHDSLSLTSNVCYRMTRLIHIPKGIKKKVITL